MMTTPRPITPRIVTAPTSTSPLRNPWSMACCTRMGTTTRPEAPTMANPNVAPMPRRSAGAASTPLPIICTADHLLSGSITERTSSRCSARSSSKASISRLVVGHRDEELVVLPMGDDPPICEVQARHRPARSSTDATPPRRRWRHASVTRRLASTLASVAGSSDDVVSSRSSAAGFPASARARAMRWRWPPLSPTPRSPTIGREAFRRSPRRSLPRQPAAPCGSRCR